jgi:hypothetical protein
LTAPIAVGTLSRMNRRAAIAALMSLPATARVSVARPEPHDVIVVELDSLPTQDGVERIRALVAEVFPNRRVLVCPGGTRIKLASG